MNRRIINTTTTASSAIISAITALLIKYHDTGELTNADMIAASAAIGGSVLLMVPRSTKEVVEEFNSIMGDFVQGHSLLTPLMLEEIMKCSQATRPYYIVCNHSDDLLWINKLAAIQQNIDKAQKFGGKETNLKSSHYPDVLELIKKKLDRQPEYFSKHKAYKLLPTEGETEVTIETFFHRVELEHGQILRCSENISQT